MTQDTNETYYKYEVFSFKGDNRKFKTLDEITKIANGCEWRLNKIQHGCCFTTNKKTAEKYNIIQVYRPI